MLKFKKHDSDKRKSSKKEDRKRSRSRSPRRSEIKERRRSRSPRRHDDRQKSSRDDRRHERSRERSRERSPRREETRSRHRSRSPEKKAKEEQPATEKPKKIKRKPTYSLIEVEVNDRLGKKVRVKCAPNDLVGDFKKLVAAQIGTEPGKIILKKWYKEYKDHITLDDYYPNMTFL